MQKILVISDNDLLNQLYVINLEVYIGANVKIIKDIVSTRNEFKEFKNYDLIISMTTLGEHDVGNIIFETLEDMSLPVPLVLIGFSTIEMPNVIIVPSSYNLQNLLRAVASVLGVTAKNMAGIALPQYYPISISYLEHIQSSPCDLYIQIKAGQNQSDYVLCSKKDSSLSTLVTKLSREAVNTLYINSQDRILMVNKISLAIGLRISEISGATTSEKSDAISAGFSFAASQIADNPEVVQEIVSIAESCAKAMDKVVSEVTGMHSLVQMLLKNKEGYLYTHSMLIAYVAKHIIRNVSWGGDSHIDRINFMVFFHDIFLVPIFEKYPDIRSEEDLLFGNILNDEEKEIVLSHARLAGEQVAKYKKCPPGVDALIKQHHGMGNGVGFATDYSDNISPLSKLFIVAEAFSEYYLREKYKNKNFKIDLKICVEDLYVKFPKHTYRKIIAPLLTIRI